MRTSSLAALGIVLAVIACGSREERGGASAGPVAKVFDASAREAGVPRDLLVAIAQTEGGLDMPRTRLHLEIDAAVPVAGPLELRHGHFDSLARGAAIMGTTELALRQDSDLALEAGARVLAELGKNSGALAEEPATWAAALETMSGYADEAHQRAYSHRVFALLARGGTFVARDGEPVTIAPHDLPPTLTIDLDATLRIQSGADYAPAEFIVTSCTNKCTPGRGGHSIEYIVIHDTEGGWDASVSTLQNDPNKSVQYIVGTDGRVAQFIHEADTAWHAGNFYYNQRSVGIEHVGYKVGPFPDAEYDASAKLVTYLTAKYGSIVKDRAHIIGHDQVPDGAVIAESDPPCSMSPSACEGTTKYGGSSNHTDPGVWEWCPYMARFGGACKCNDVTAIFNCAHDMATAVRCVGGNVELLTCDGPGACETMPNGTDDVCHQAPVPEAAPPPPVPPDSDSGTPPVAAPPPEPPANSAKTGDESSGCSAAPSRETGTSGGLLPLFGLALFAAARRRRAR